MPEEKKTPSPQDADAAHRKQVLREWQEDGVENTGHWRWVKLVGLPGLGVYILLMVILYLFGKASGQIAMIGGVALFVVISALKPFFPDNKVKDE